MNKLFFIKALLIPTLISTPIFGMLIEKDFTINDLLQHDVRKTLFEFLHKRDQTDMRLICKKWACKGPDWKFMPNNLEKKYDKKRKQKEMFRSVDKNIILFELVAEQDADSVQWILSNELSHIGIVLSLKCSLYPSMIAIHNKNPELARLLIKSECSLKKRSWKSYYNKLPVPQAITECLYTGENRNFSFLLYLNAVWSDNSNNLKKFYKQRVPTSTGKRLLIYECLEENAPDCFNFLLKQKDIQEIICDDKDRFFRLAINTHRKEIPQQLLNKKLFYLNRSIDIPHRTILDYYDDIKDAKAIALLLELGAKKWDELHH